MIFSEKQKEPIIKDSGERREFATGAVRDIQEGKGRCDLMPLDVIEEYLWTIGAVDFGAEEEDRSLHCIFKFQATGEIYWLFNTLREFTDHCLMQDHHTMILELSKHFEAGAKKYGENNWKKGIPVHCYIDSAVRHYLKHLRGDTDEPHHLAFCWNIVCAIWTVRHMPELDDYHHERNANS